MAGVPPGRHPGSPPRSGPQPLRARPPVPPPGRRPSSGEPAARPRGARPPAAPAPHGPAGASPSGPGRRPGRLRRFVARHGWRAYAIPVLTVVTVLTLVDVVGSGGATPPGPATDGAPAATSAAATTSPAATATPTAALEGGTAPAEGDANPTGLPTAPAAGTYVEQGAGSVTVVPGTSAVYGSGPLQRFVVEVEDGIGVDGASFAAAVEATLGDARSWGNGGAMSFQRVDATAPGSYEFRVSLVSPGSMERYCPGVGTGGYTSCRYGERAVINLARWETAVPDYQGDVATYRQYVVNHEVGHALGNGHRPCPGAGQLAPVMQQQTLGLDGCQKNAWPFP
ncbi:Protein of unknown function [Geodermatophilus obscurus]|uniref:DUF3152 domain-containing protein n=1 Tax=Geodermatophilus obscurus TaxID=1861 RepID=A0A1I5GVK0_9ACTN|nr:DUF3152 domain-containing protein [Geodermatophilus obscurus]SFO39913.1 Protein of unknown function [Geodermatophilus obscurus]